eukprot:6988741-Prymnesium_polylepis.1
MRSTGRLHYHSSLRLSSTANSRLRVGFNMFGCVASLGGMTTAHCANGNYPIQSRDTDEHRDARR